MNEEQKYIIIKEHEQRKRKTFDFKVFEGYYGKRNTEDIEVPYGHALILLPATAYDECKYFEGYKGNGYREESDARIHVVTICHIFRLKLKVASILCQNIAMKWLK